MARPDANQDYAYLALVKSMARSNLQGSRCLSREGTMALLYYDRGVLDG
jgi:hypothetical protein